MKLVSVNVGLPRNVLWKGKVVTTGIFKEPVEGRVMLRRINLDGDAQADLAVHGGAHKAAYAYPVEHYDFWRRELPGRELPFGMFGENLTTEGLSEDEVCIGDRFRIGEAELVATQPRLPCFKLGLKFGRDDMAKRFLASGRTGFYFAVLREGLLGAGDAIERTARESHRIRVADITRLYMQNSYDEDDLETLQHASRVEALPENWRRHFRERMEATIGK
jgi:MOSC domain-containing protein YiiM